MLQYAAKFANGPGAIYVGFLPQLAGPAPSTTSGDPDTDLGDSEGNVPLYALEDYRWLYESDYYQSLIYRANLTNPTELTSSGERIRIQHACINRALLPCKVIEQYWAPNLEARTNGQLILEVSSLPELGLAGSDTLKHVSDGTLSMANIYTPFVFDELPTFEVQTLWGVHEDSRAVYLSLTDMQPQLRKMVARETGDGIIVNNNWFFGNDLFFFSETPLQTLRDFEGLKIRSYSTTLSDWINGMGATARSVPFAEVYTALVRGNLDVGATSANAGHGQRWFEVTNYLSGPLSSVLSTHNVVNAVLWARIPADLQRIFIEEGTKAELEQLRLASIQSMIGVQKNIDAGMEVVEFSPELAEYSLKVAAKESVIPAWLQRLGYPGKGDEAVAIFNQHVGPYIGTSIGIDGTVNSSPLAQRSPSESQWLLPPGTPTKTLEHLELPALSPWQLYKATPLHQAVINHEPIIVEAVLDYGANVNAVSRIINTSLPRAVPVEGFTPLHGAAGFNSNPTVATLLLDRGASMHSKTTSGLTPLHYAVGYNLNSAVAALLLDQGANIFSRTTGGATPLHYAARHNSSLETTTLLLERGAREEIRARDSNGHTVLHYAASNSNPAVAELLIDLGLEIDLDTINIAAKSNINPAVIILLLERGRDVLATTNHSYSLTGLLHSAAEYNPEPAVAEVILDRGADVQATTSTRALNNKSFSGVTALHVAARANQEPTVIKLLVERGATVQIGDSGDHTPLHYAAAHNPNPDIIATLLDLGADIEAGNERGMTPLHMSVLFNSSSAVAEILLEHNADVNAADHDGRTPLHMAVVQWHSRGSQGRDLVQVLLDQGADVTIENNEGRTPCRLAQLEDKYTGTPLMGRLCGG